MRGLLQLSMTSRLKPLHYASTMGIFPQYFCQFANEFADKPVKRDAFPDLADMQAKMPLGLLGYPWSKMAVEQVAARKQPKP